MASILKKRGSDGKRLSLPFANSSNVSEEDIAPYPEPEIGHVALDNKRGARMKYTYYPASIPRNNNANPFSQTLIVFVNGLMLPRSSWDATIKTFLERRQNAQLPYPALLSYDRYGQGESDRDPEDKEPPPCHGHDIMSVVKSLKQLTVQIWRDHLDINRPTHYPCLIFVCNSIGCAIARLFTQCYPGTVSGMLFLDSIMANSDFQSFWPDPDAPDFNPQILPESITADDVRATRAAYRKMFHPDVPNNEGLSRKNLAQYLPYSDGPKLEGYLGRGPYLTIAGHDWQTFADQSYNGSLKTPKIMTMTYANPAWTRYNEGLVNITDEGRAIGPITAVNCGHFIQQDGPEFVADEMTSLLDRVVNRVEQVSERD